MAWFILFLAGLFEIGWAVCLKYTKGFTQPWPTIGFGSFMIASVWLLGIALKSLPLGTAYTIWTGIGAVGTVIFGIFILDESADTRRLICILFIIVGIVGLKLLVPSNTTNG